MSRPLITTALLGLGLAGCTGLPEGTRAVTGFTLDRYLGQWYEIARLDHSFEEGLDCVTADYSRREESGVRVINRGVDLAAGEENVAEGKAYPIGEPGQGRLKVSFFGPFYAGYNVLALDEAYDWALVAGPDRDYLWILSRTPDMEPATYQTLVERARALDFPVEGLIEVEQGEACAAWR
ncbi:lipocalin family protein [Halomonas saccharevitans]|uniref:Outer membrane lipoprotein Blc n=1 Tax=Halomonas saccharevitans TaxID=416872 RepID=A0A1I6XUW6_9GAMM|nr:lipocalin family protein [Halomonas saccharevitans]MDT8879548.1 lipocalin family protein [Halomonas saccharevitans]SFT41887.1 apolipoprotein D and lipocalin family protein [Halomonas saccharevitans]